MGGNGTFRMRVPGALRILLSEMEEPGGDRRKIQDWRGVFAMMRVLFFLFIPVLPMAALDYKRDVMPIFEAKCYDCHSDEAKKVKGGLRLDDEGHFLKRFSKNEVVVPGDWDASYLFVTLVMPQHEKGAMPPKNKGERLSEKEIMTVAKWIHEGAKIDGKRGRKGPDKWNPEKRLKFKDGRIVTEQFGPAPEVKELTWEIWTNGAGKEIVARFQGLEGGKVSFELRGGKTVLYPLEGLSEESQKKVEMLAASGGEMME